MPTEPRSIHRMDVIEVDHTIGRNPIGISRQSQLRDQAPFRPGQHSNHYRSNPIRQWVASQDQDRAIPAGGIRKPNVTPQHRPSLSNPRPGPSQQHLPGKPQQLTRVAPTRRLPRLRPPGGPNVVGSPFEVTQTGLHRVESPTRQDPRSQYLQAAQKSSSYGHYNS